MRTKAISDERALELTKKYYEVVCGGDPYRLSIPEIARYIERETGKKYTAVTLRRCKPVRDYINILLNTSEKKAEQERTIIIASYRPLNARQLLLDFPTKDRLIEKLTDIDAYYKKVVDLASELSEKCKALTADIEDLKRERSQKNAEMKELKKRFTKLKNEYKGMSSDLKHYKAFVDDYINPDIADVLLQQEGLIKKKVGSSVSNNSVNKHMVTADTLLLDDDPLETIDPDDDSLETVDPDEVMIDDSPSESNIIDFMKNKLL